MLLIILSMKTDKKITYIAVAIAILAVFILLFGFSLPIFAEETNVSATVSTETGADTTSAVLKTNTELETKLLEEQRETLKQQAEFKAKQVESLKATTEANRETVKQNLEATREATKTRLEAEKTLLKQKAEALRESAKDKLEATREEAKNRFETAREATKEQLEQKREELKQQLETRKEAIAKQLEVKRETIKANIEQKREAFANRVETKKAELATRGEEIKKRLETKAQEQVGKIVTNIIERFDSTVQNLIDLRARIESRITKFQEAGSDVSASINLLATADAKLEIAKTEITKSQALIDSLLATASTTPISNTNIHAAVEVAKTSIKDAHSAYVDVVESLKEVTVPDESKLIEIEAVTTTDTTASTQ